MAKVQTKTGFQNIGLTRAIEDHYQTSDGGQNSDNNCFIDLVKLRNAL